MTRPPLDALVLGHPVVMTTGTLGALGMLFYGFHDPSWLLLGILMLFAVQPLGRFNKERARYLAWKREWDALGNSGDWR